MKCPICRKEVEPGTACVPFCSDRCRLIDLGNWASEKYRIPVKQQPGETGAEDDEEASGDRT